MISVLNFRPYDKGSVKGFFDLRYHGLTVKGCRLLRSDKGYWFNFPQEKRENGDGNAQYYDQVFLTKPEMEHVRKLVLMDLRRQGHLSDGAAKEHNPTTDLDDCPF